MVDVLVCSDAAVGDCSSVVDEVESFDFELRVATRAEAEKSFGVSRGIV